MATSKFYAKYAVQLMRLNITDDSMYILIPSENDDQVYYRVDVNEETMAPIKCGCRGYSYRERCKHLQIVSEAFAGYKPVVPPTEPVEPKITEVEAGNWYIVNSDTSVWRNEESQWMAVGPTENAIEIVEAYLEKQQAVAEAEQIVAEAPKVERVTFWCKNKHCRCYLDTREPVDPITYAEKIAAQVKEYERDILDAPLNGNRSFELLMVS